MDPILLQFKDVNVEKEYERRVLLGLKKFDVSVLWWPMRMAFVIKWMMEMRALVKMPFAVGAVALSLMPLVVYIIQYKSSEAWFLKHSKSMRLVQGLVQVILRAVLVRFLFVNQLSKRPVLASDTIVALGLPVALDNVFWFHTGFKSYLVTSTFAAVVWHALILAPYCTATTSSSYFGFSAPMNLILGGIREFLDLFTGSHYDTGLRIDICHQAFSFSHIYFCVAVVSIAIWSLERKSRISFIDLEYAERGGHDFCQNVYAGESSEWVMVWFLIPLFWQAVTLIQHIVSQYII